MMKTYKYLYGKLCSFENLEDAYLKARKHKLFNPNVIEFGRHWKFHLFALQRELKAFTYKLLPMKRFVLRDPKTRIICVSEFRDRIVHHALVNILQPIFEPRFIYDSYASRAGKGTSSALIRFDAFLKKATKNGRLSLNARNANEVQCYALKADIKHYFDSVDQNILTSIIQKRIKDKGIIWLTRTILANYSSGAVGKGMPLGNWTSQFFANVYLNELDYFIKHKLKAKYYLRYVDDFVLLHASRKELQEYERKIAFFLLTLGLELHPAKCKIIPAKKGISLLGFRIFYHYKLVRKRNLRAIKEKLGRLIEEYERGSLEAWKVLEAMDSWNAYASQGNTYKLMAKLEEHAKQCLKSSRKANLA